MRDIEYELLLKNRDILSLKIIKKIIIHTLHIDVHQELQITDMKYIQKPSKRSLQISF